MKDSLTCLLLHLADNALVLGHRNSEWTGHGPILEQDIAISNIALDLVGHARNFYQATADLINQQAALPIRNSSAYTQEEGSCVPFLPNYIAGDTGMVTEDTLAYLRNANQYLNLLMMEQPRGDWALTTLRQFLVSAYQLVYFHHLLSHKAPEVKAIAEKSLKEIHYHFTWSGEWVVRLGDGTSESHSRLVKALKILWPYTGEFFEAEWFETAEGLDTMGMEAAWQKQVIDIFDKATLLNEFSGISAEGKKLTGGKRGIHGKELESMLEEMQVLQRTYPGCEW